MMEEPAEKWLQRNYTPIDVVSFNISNVNNHILKAVFAELSSPASTIHSNLQLLKRCGYRGNLSLINETYSMSEESIKIILDLVGNINFLCSVNKTKPDQKWCMVSSLVNQALFEIRDLNNALSRINLTIMKANIPVFIDAIKFKRMLVNLLSNALKFSKSNIDLYISKAKDKLSAIIHDYGIGIPKDEIKTVFNPFVRGSNAGHIPGSGLGLAIVAKSIAQLNGSLEINTEKDVGTIFKVNIPINNF